MKQLFIGIIFILLLGGISSAEETNQKIPIFDIFDPVGDDYGAGNVQYPENPNFKPGMFDITRFTVSKDNEHVIFRIEINEKITYLQFDEFEYRYQLPQNFFLQLIQIYIDTDQISGSGFMETIHGCNVVVDSSCAWEYAVVMSPIPDRFSLEVHQSQPDIARRVIVAEDVEVERKRQAFLIYVPIDQIGIPEPTWGYTVLMLGHDFSVVFGHNTYVRTVNSAANQWNFGGGLARSADPNVIDLITSPSHPQEKVLKRYDREEKTFSSVYAVYGQRKDMIDRVISGEVMNTLPGKIAVNLGTAHGITVGTKLLIENKITATVKEAFPDLSIAIIESENDIPIEIGMSVTILK